MSFWDYSETKLAAYLNKSSDAAQLTYALFPFLGRCVCATRTALIRSASCLRLPTSPATHSFPPPAPLSFHSLSRPLVAAPVAAPVAALVVLALLTFALVARRPGPPPSRRPRPPRLRRGRCAVSFPLHPSIALRCGRSGNGLVRPGR